MGSSEHDNNDDPAALDGLSLKEAFDKHVFCDSETETIRPGVEGAPRWLARWHLTVDGKARARAYYTPPAPRIRVRKMVIKGRETGRLHRVQPSQSPQPTITDEMQRPFDCVAHRFNQLIGWLRSGDLIARGWPENSADPKEIYPMLWKDNSYMIDVRNSTFLQKVGKVWDVKFRTIWLVAKANKEEMQKPHEKPVNQKRVNRDQVRKALEHVFSGPRSAKSKVREEIMAKFPDLSAREFNNCWAIKAPDDWKKAGRIKKRR